MRTLEDILHPVTPAQFRAEYEGRQPLHIPAAAGSPKRDLLTWDAFNGLLNQSNVWTSERLQLMHHDAAVPPEQYCRLKRTPEGHVWRPSPAKVEVFLSAGASILANDVMTLHSPITHAAVALGEALAAEVGASVFCSFKGGRAVATHYDVHEVFAVQTSGEKVWNLYEGREVDPVGYPPGATQADFNRACGRLVSTVTMKPGDVLYMPRGVYHDTVTPDQPSLHVSFTAMPLTGRGILSLLDGPALQDPAFRAWLPAADAEGGALLQARLAELAGRLAEIVASPAFRDEVALLQRRLMPRAADFSLPVRKPANLYRTTGRAFPDQGPLVRRVFDWIIEERQFAVEDLVAEMDSLSEARVRDAVASAERAGAIQPV
jgi:ribosomal protein L16 Arg81 hydroxylase